MNELSMLREILRITEARLLNGHADTLESVVQPVDRFLEGSDDPLGDAKALACFAIMQLAGNLDWISGHEEALAWVRGKIAQLAVDEAMGGAA